MSLVSVYVHVHVPCVHVVMCPCHCVWIHDWRVVQVTIGEAVVIGLGSAAVLAGTSAIGMLERRAFHVFKQGPLFGCMDAGMLHQLGRGIMLKN